MKLEHLEEFLMLAETGNYGSAAENMFITISSLSRHIILLEEELGTELFYRGPKTVSLTRTGSMLVPYAKLMTEAKSAYIKELADDANMSKTVLSVSFDKSLIQYGVIDQIMKFHDENPDLTVNIYEGNPASRLHALKYNEYDFCVGVHYPFFDSPDIQSIPLIKDSFAIAMPETHRFAKETKISLRQLNHEHFILNSKESPAYRSRMQLFQEEGVKPRVLTHAESGRFIIGLVGHGEGLAIVEKNRFKRSLPSGVVLVPLDPLRVQTFGLFYKKRDLSPAEKRFLEFITKVYPYTEE